MGKTLVIAECGSSWDCDIQKAFRLIEAAKECGADVAKFQWTSNAKAMAERRLGANAARSIEMYKRYLEYPLDVLTRLKAHCDSVGIEFMVTVYLVEDIATIAPLVKRFKVSAFESDWTEFITAHLGHYKPVIISVNPDKNVNGLFDAKFKAETDIQLLHCVSKYPCPLEELELSSLGEYRNVLATVPLMYKVYDGLSDHSVSLLTGAQTVSILGDTEVVIEKHIRLHDTHKDCPDYGHSLVANEHVEYSDHTYTKDVSPFWHYVSNIREAEKAL
jgi:sialic acid synthase SpsE